MVVKPRRGDFAILGVVFFLVLLAYFATVSAQGFRAPMPLGKLIGTADAIIIGSISKIDDTTFTLEVKDTLAGKPEGGLLEIAKFVAPVENPRWADYAKGQRLAVFLVKGSHLPLRLKYQLSDWKILGWLGEGEIALEGSYAYFHRRFITTLQPDYYSFHGQTSYLQRIKRDTLVDAIRGYRACFDWTERVLKEGRPVLTCSPAALSVYRERSPLHIFLVQETDEIY